MPTNPVRPKARDHPNQQARQSPAEIPPSTPTYSLRRIGKRRTQAVKVEDIRRQQNQPPATPRPTPLRPLPQVTANPLITTMRLSPNSPATSCLPHFSAWSSLLLGQRRQLPRRCLAVSATRFKQPLQRPHQLRPLSLHLNKMLRNQLREQFSSPPRNLHQRTPMVALIRNASHQTCLLRPINQLHRAVMPNHHPLGDDKRSKPAAPPEPPRPPAAPGTAALKSPPPPKPSH